MYRSKYYYVKVTSFFLIVITLFVFLYFNGTVKKVYAYTHTIRQRTDGKYVQGIFSSPLQGGWAETEDGMLYLRDDGTPMDGFCLIDDMLYDFKRGIPKSGWQILGDSVYYFDADGHAVEGLQRIADGLYFFGSAHAVRTGWQVSGGDRYYFGYDGKAVSGFTLIDGDTYYFDRDGVMQTGLQSVDGDVYCFDRTGRMQTGRVKTDGEYAYFDESGKRILDGWYSDGERRYYIDANGQPLTGWQEIDNRKYCFTEDGSALTGRQELDGKTYRFDDDGVMQTGYVDEDGQTRYYMEDGSLLVNGYIDEYRAGPDGSLEVIWSRGNDSEGVSGGEHPDFSGRPGTAGRLFIPSLGVDVALYYARLDADAQEITDAHDSAAYITETPEVLIADHWNQGFEAINGCVPGETIAYIKNGDGMTAYICTVSTLGHNTSTDLVDNSGYSYMSDPSGGFTAYTCVNGWQNVRIVRFVPL